MIAAPRTSMKPRWRLEIYSMEDHAVEALRIAESSSLAVSIVGSGNDDHSAVPSDLRWTEPRLELDVDVMDPFTDESLTSLLGPDHRLLFVTGHEAVVDKGSTRLRIRRFRFG